MNDYYQVRWHAKTKAQQDFIFTEMVRSDMLGKIIDIRVNQPESLGILSVVPAEVKYWTEQMIKDGDELHKTLIAREEEK